MRALLAFCLGAGLLLSTSCVSYYAPVMPPAGGLFTKIGAPLDTNAQQTPTGNRIGRASSSSVLGMFAFGDCSTNAAVQNGGLTKVEYLDYEYFNLLFVYQKFTVNAYGE